MDRMGISSLKGFTLIELLIVIAIIAVLSVVVILSLNPAELLRQARDSNRISDMSTLKSAIALYLADIATPAIGTTGWCYTSGPTSTGANPVVFDSVATNGTWAAGALNCAAWSVVATTTAQTTSTISRAIDKTGWIPIRFSDISSGSPIGQEPVDPTNATGTPGCTGTTPPNGLSSCSLFYTYVPSGTSFKLAAFMESSKYSKTGTGHVTDIDGGNNPYVFEGGTNPTF